MLLLVLAWAPIPIGSNREWSAELLAAGMLVVSGGWLLSYTWRPFRMPGAVHAARTPLILLVMWAAYPLIQLIPLPVAIATLTGGEIHGFYAELPAGSMHGQAYLSLDRGATFSGFLRQCGLVALLSSVLVLVSSTKRLYALMMLIVLVGFAEALYGIVLIFPGDELGLWSPGQSDDTVSGTYVNQNHFAGLMELAIPVGFGLLMSSYSASGSVSGTRDLTRFVTGILLSQSGIILFCILIMSASLILTTSRGGIGSLALGIAVATAIAVSKKGARAKELRIGMLAVILALIAISWLGAGQLSEKLATAGFSSNRAEQLELSYRIIEESPLTGTGVGTYRWIFPAYKDQRFGGYFYEHAHNDFLEILAEQGVIGFSLLAVGVVLIFVRIVRAFVQRRDPFVQGALFASIAGCVSLLIHGLVDFNLQIPANVSYFFALLGVGVVASKVRSQSEAREFGSGRARQS